MNISEGVRELWAWADKKRDYVAAQNCGCLECRTIILCVKEVEAIAATLEAPAAPAEGEKRGERYTISVRPWSASGGSSVHDEAVTYEAKSPYHALMQLYEANEYDWEHWRVIDWKVEAAAPAPESHEGKSK